LDRLIKISLIVIVVLLLSLIGYETYQTHLINQQSAIPAENQKILLERTKLFETISNLDKKSLAILENRTEIINSIVENSLINRDLLSRLANKIESLDKKVDDIVKSNQMVTPK
jgi:hypothetical protein